MSAAKTVACLAGDGAGPELMAAATRALRAVARLHSVELDDVHLPFAGEALTRSGHPLPRSTRAGYREADAIIVASPDEPALEGVKADLHLTSRIARVHVGAGRDVVVIGAVDASADARALAKAFSCAASRRGRVACVGDSAAWRDAVARERARWGGMEVEQPSLGETLVRLDHEPQSLDVVATEAHLVAPLAEAAAHFAGSGTAVANGWLTDRGPALFAPGASEPDDVAGLGVADPTGMLFTVSLLLAEGLRRRSAARTLERAVGQAARARPPRDTRRFTDAVVELLPQARTDVEHFDEVWR